MTAKAPAKSKHPWRRLLVGARTFEIVIPFTTAELARVEEAAAAAEMSVDDYIVVCMLDAEGHA